PQVIQVTRRFRYLKRKGRDGVVLLVWLVLPLYNPHTRRRTQVVKGAVCKTAMRRFDPARRLHYFTHPTPRPPRRPLFPRLARTDHPLINFRMVGMFLWAFFKKRG